MYTIQSFPQLLKFTMNGRKPHPKSKFTPQEDDKLRSIVKDIGESDWNAVAKKMGTRNQRQCKERWFNYLSPNVKSLPWTAEDDQKLESLHSEFGAKWVKIAQYFPSRTDTNIKSRWMVLQRQKRRVENKVNQDQQQQQPTAVVPMSFISLQKSDDKPSISNEYQLSNNCSQNIDTILPSLSDPNIYDSPFLDEQMGFAPMDVITDQCYDFFEWN